MIIAILFSVNSFAQEMNWENNGIKWINIGKWDNPSGVANSTDKIVRWYESIHDSIVSSYYANHPDKILPKDKLINDTTWYFNRNEYRWVRYKNLSRQAQLKVRVKIKREVKTPKKVIESIAIQDEIERLLGLGYSVDSTAHIIDSVYYGVRKY